MVSPNWSPYTLALRASRAQFFANRPGISAVLVTVTASIHGSVVHDIGRQPGLKTICIIDWQSSWLDGSVSKTWTLEKACEEGIRPACHVSGRHAHSGRSFSRRQARSGKSTVTKALIPIGLIMKAVRQTRETPIGKTVPTLNKFRRQRAH